MLSTLARVRSVLFLSLSLFLSTPFFRFFFFKKKYSRSGLELEQKRTETERGGNKERGMRSEKLGRKKGREKKREGMESRKPGGKRRK